VLNVDGGDFRMHFLFPVMDMTQSKERPGNFSLNLDRFRDKLLEFDFPLLLGLFDLSSNSLLYH
jgi:hypothetical protein